MKPARMTSPSFCVTIRKESATGEASPWNLEAIAARRSSWRAGILPVQVIITRASVGVTGRYTRDNYDSQFGVQDGTTWSLNLDGTFNYSERGSISASTLWKVAAMMLSLPEK